MGHIINFYLLRKNGRNVKLVDNWYADVLLYIRYTNFGGLAQLGEHLPYKQRVGGSIPSASTII